MLPKQIRIGLCADTHFWQNGICHTGSNGSLQLQPCSDLILSTLLAELQTEKPDLVLHLGDTTCGGGFFNMAREDFYSSLDTVHDEMMHLSAETHALPGNHDCPPGGGDWSYFEQLWGLVAGTGATIDLPTARLVLLNAQGHSREQIEDARPTDPAYGWVNDIELLRLEESLATAGDKPVVLFCHQLLRPWVSNHNPWAYFYGVKNADAVLEVMARYSNVHTVFQAHAHRLDVHRSMVGSRPCNFVVIPAIIEYPLGWMCLDFSVDSLHMQLRCLPMPELSKLSLKSGQGQAWRLGQANWSEMSFDFK